LSSRYEKVKAEWDARKKAYDEHQAEQRRLHEAAAKEARDKKAKEAEEKAEQKKRAGAALRQ
jgi:hypothetical protein